MNFETIKPITEAEDVSKQEKEKEMITDTKSFKDAIEKGQVELAEKWMKTAYVENEKYKGNEKWIEAQQRILLGAYCDAGNKDGAIRIIEETKEFRSQEGRIKKYESFFGSYTGTKVERPDPKKVELPANITDTASFKKYLDAGKIDEAEEWLSTIEGAGRYKVLIKGDGEFEKFAHDRKKELRDAKK